MDIKCPKGTHPVGEKCVENAPPPKQNKPIHVPIGKPLPKNEPIPEEGYEGFDVKKILNMDLGYKSEPDSGFDATTLPPPSKGNRAPDAPPAEGVTSYVLSSDSARKDFGVTLKNSPLAPKPPGDVNVPASPSPDLQKEQEANRDKYNASQDKVLGVLH